MFAGIYTQPIDEMSDGIGISAESPFPGELLEQLENAVEAVRVLTAALNRAAPNGRDFYVYSPDQTQRAIKEHCLRQEKVLEVAAELVMMRDHVQECINLKAESTRNRL